MKTCFKIYVYDTETKKSLWICSTKYLKLAVDFCVHWNTNKFKFNLQDEYFKTYGIAYFMEVLEND